MNEVDWLIAALLGLSTIVGLMRGIVREILAIVGWVVAIILVMRFSTMLGEVIPFESLHLGIRTVIAAILIIVATLFTMGMLGRILGHALSAAKITFEDRTLGALFGLFRGVVIVCAFVFLFSMTSMVRSGLWRNSILIVPAEKVIDMSMPFMPEKIVELRAEYQIR